MWDRGPETVVGLIVLAILVIAFPVSVISFDLARARYRNWRIQHHSKRRDR